MVCFQAQMYTSYYSWLTLHTSHLYLSLLVPSCDKSEGLFGGLWATVFLYYLLVLLYYYLQDLAYYTDSKNTVV